MSLLRGYEEPSLGDDMKRRIFAILIISLSILSSCSRPDTEANKKSSGDVGKPVSGDWVIVRYEGEPDVLNPVLNNNAYANYVMFGSNSNQIYDFLLAYDTKDWTYSKPILAEG